MAMQGRTGGCILTPGLCGSFTNMEIWPSSTPADLKNGTRSHFDAQDMMERGIQEQKNLGLGTGWLTRLLGTLPGTGLLPGLSADGAMPASLLGSTRAAAIATLQDFGYYGDDRQMKALRLLHAQSGALGAGGNRMLDLLAAVTKKLPQKDDGSVADYVPAKGVDLSRARLL